MPKAAKSANLRRRDGREKLVHPNSRQATRLCAKAHRENRMDDQVKKRSQKLEHTGDRCRWFQEHLDPDKATYTKQECCHLIDVYLGRFADELEQIGIKQSMKGRSGLQHAARHDAITRTQEAERSEYDSAGLEIPDLVNGKSLAYLRTWQGELRLLQNIKMRRVKSSDRESKLKAEQPLEEQEATLSDIHTLYATEQNVQSREDTEECTSSVTMEEVAAADS